MKALNLKTSILIASIYAAVHFGILQFVNEVYPKIAMPIMGDKAHTYMLWRVWTPMLLGMIAILLLGFLVYKTDWKKR